MGFCETDDPATYLDDPTCIPTAPPIVVSAVGPCRVARDGPIPVVITGSGFDELTSVSIRGEATVIARTSTRLEVQPPPELSGSVEVTVSSAHQADSRRATFLWAEPGAEPDSLRMAKLEGGAIRILCTANSWFTIERAREPSFACETLSTLIGRPPETRDDPDWENPLLTTPVWFYRAE